MSQLEYKLGLEIQLEKEKYRIVRIIERSHSLHAEGDKEMVIDESYIELKGQSGEIEFVTLSSDKKPYEGPKSTIAAPTAIPWNKGDS